MAKRDPGCRYVVRRGIVGIEAAIVLIAFVIVAAALAFVALNMGLFTTQKSKEVMQRGLEEATSALEVDGSVIGRAVDIDTTQGSSDIRIDAIAVPIKVAPGREGVDLSVTLADVNADGVLEIVDSRLTVRLLLPSGFFETIYCGVVHNPTDPTTGGPAELSAIISSPPADCPNQYPRAFIAVFSSDGDPVLEFGEKGLLIIQLGDAPNAITANMLVAYDEFAVEIRVVQGASLTVERSVPPTLPQLDTYDKNADLNVTPDEFEYAPVDLG